MRGLKGLHRLRVSAFSFILYGMWGGGVEGISRGKELKG